MVRRPAAAAKRLLRSRGRRYSRLAAALAGLAIIWLGLAVAAPAALAEQVPPGGGSPTTAAGTVTRTVVVGGMPGWQIALIAAAAALFAAGLTVLAHRTRADRHAIPTTA